MSIFFRSCIGIFEVTYVGKRIGTNWIIFTRAIFPGLFLALFFLLGGLFACCFYAVCSDAGCEELVSYLADYLRVCNKAASVRAFWPTFWSEVRFGAAAVLFGWTTLGVIGFPLLFVARGFFLVFSIGAFLLSFGSRGFLPAVLLFLLPALFWAPALFLLGDLGLSRLIQIRSRKDGGRDPCSSEDIFSLFLALLLYFACAVTESALISSFLPWIAEYVL